MDQMRTKNTKLVPPDGGYGWVIVFASALNNFVAIPLMQSFGLIFKDTFITLGLSATQSSLIINVNSACGMLMGLINGPLLNHFGYRKISHFGAFMIFIGVILTSFSRTFVQFLISYGCVTSLGLGLTMSSYSLAINTYFQKRKSKAVGLSMTITGLGPILMPQIINLLLIHYSVAGVTLVLAAICGHSFVAASLLQPVKWHMIKAPLEEQEILQEEEPNSNNRTFKRSISQPEGTSIITPETEAASLYGMDSTLGGSVLSLNTSRRPSNTIDHKTMQWCQSEQSINLESSVDIFSNNKTKPGNLSDSFEEEPQRTCWKKVMELFDLDLLKDPIYVNIMMGMSLAVFAELNFSVLTAFILSDFGLTTGQIATFMSILGVADIIFRFLAPFIGDFLNFSPRIMYMLTLTGLIITRFCLLLTTQFEILLGVALVLGVAKGVRTVYMSLVIPVYVPLERLASASGIQMMVNGVCTLIGGPLLGVVRDATGSYKMCIVIMNMVTLTTIVMWSIEMVIRRRNLKKCLRTNAS